MSLIFLKKLKKFVLYRFDFYFKKIILGAGRDRHRISHRLLYLLKNPWDLERPSEKFRFEESCKIIKNKFGNLNTIIELACGEGHQSLHLKNNCNNLIGIDCSNIAVKRAKQRLPNDTFLCSNIDQYLEKLEKQSSDTLIVAAEILYYLPDPEKTIKKITEKSSKAVVTLYRGGNNKIGHILIDNNWKGPEVITYESSKFFVYWFSDI